MTPPGRRLRRAKAAWRCWALSLPIELRSEFKIQVCWRHFLQAPHLSWPHSDARNVRTLWLCDNLADLKFYTQYRLSAHRSDTTRPPMKAVEFCLCQEDYARSSRFNSANGSCKSGISVSPKLRNKKHIENELPMQVHTA